MTSKLVMYHGGCMDGFTAAWAAWQAFGDDAEYVPLYYGENSSLELPDVKGKDVWMLDICASREELIRMHNEAASFRVLDHHKSHQEACAGLPFCTFDMEHSGAWLAWDHFFPYPRGGQFPRLVLYTEDRDLWKMEMSKSKEVNAYYSTIEKTFPNWEKLSQVSFEEAVAKGEGALAWLNHYVREVGREAKKIRWIDRFTNKTYTIYVVNVPYLGTSELVGSLASRGVDFAVGWFEKKNGTYQYGLRSRDGKVDVSEIAKSRGGGGHANAAGFVSAERERFW